ncbi:enolase C-terminal domain-like protein [Streptomyces sp. NBC_00878]|uniref:enolase C-terminal domain-like protein n=1 Tax=Streptomyces sp. NBC_00878 TaxID=2975854 RepID=UPI002250647E|nr:enolase C-terminal domain-like protein [Streptomyces sp. NBC_00878]MCX4908178.1 glucarate dehydratase [Streptomyces sp. NBC_00878]
MKIVDVTVTPIAFGDPPLLNSTGVHEPLVLRCVVQLHLEDGTVGLGECPGGRTETERLRAAADAVRGLDVFATGRARHAVHDALRAGTSPVETSRVEERDSAWSPLEVAMLDAQGKLTGRSVSDLLGGAVRDAVPYSGYLFYKWAEHPPLDGRPALADEWGAALDPDGLVDQARRMIDLYGFGSLKLKGGVFPPDQEIAAVRALAAAFPGLPLRIDPNAAWSVETSRRVARELTGVLEYLEDPTPGIAGMGEVARSADMPLATNMIVSNVEHVRPAVRHDAVQVLLLDHHLWGGLRRSRELAVLCEALGIGLSMHSNSHLGISLAAMTHLAATVPELTYACDTHYPWNAEHDVVKPGALRFAQGSVRVPTGPGLGVELDHEALDRLHRAYLESGRERRDDTAYMRRVDPAYDPGLPRW